LMLLTLRQPNLYKCRLLRWNCCFQL